MCLFVFVKSSEGRKEASRPFESVMATFGKMVFLTFEVCTWEERAGARGKRELDFACHRRSSTGEVSSSIRSHVACVLNHRESKINNKQWL